MDRELLNRALGEAAQSASEAGIKISFDISDKESLRRRAMREAVTDARENATLLAEAAGVSLGDISKIDYSFIQVRHQMGFDLGRDALSAPAFLRRTPDIEPNEVNAVQNATVVWKITG